METEILQNDIYLIMETMKSRNVEGIYGYIDRENGEVLMGCHDAP